MARTNRDMAHRFFNPKYLNERYYPNYMNCGYEGDRFFSYATVIAMVVKDRNGHKVTLISDNSMSKSTARHRNLVLSCSPYKDYWVPFRHGERPRDLEDVSALFHQALEKRSKLNFCLQDNRFLFCDTFAEATKFSKDIYELDFLDSYKGLYNQLNDPEAVKKLKAKARKERLEKLKNIKKFLKEKPYLEVIQYTYEYKEGKDYELILEAHQVLNPYNNLSFVWRTNRGSYRTSGRIVIAKEDGDKALRLWKEGKLSIGYKVGTFVVSLVTDDFVRIGCHTIPTKNLEALYECL